MLNRLVERAIAKGVIKTLKVGNKEVNLSHLQFAKDTIIFCPQNEEKARNCRRLLQFFEVMSGLSINFEKSMIIPLNCEERWIARSRFYLGCSSGKLPLKYLGIPLEANPKRIGTWKPNIEKIEKKLSLWKSRFISKAGKIVFIKSVLNSLPLYYFGLFKMPKMVAKKIISLQSNFFFG